MKNATCHSHYAHSGTRDPITVIVQHPISKCRSTPAVVVETDPNRDYQPHLHPQHFTDQHA